MPCSDVTYRPMNSERALKLFNIAVAHMKFANISAIYQLNSRQPHRTHQASAAITPEQKTDVSSRPPWQWECLEMKPQRSRGIIQPEWANVLMFNVVQTHWNNREMARKIWQSLVEMIRVLPVLSLSTSGASADHCLLQPTPALVPQQPQ